MFEMGKTHVGSGFLRYFDDVCAIIIFLSPITTLHRFESIITSTQRFDSEVQPTVRLISSMCKE